MLTTAISDDEASDNGKVTVSLTSTRLKRTSTKPETFNDDDDDEMQDIIKDEVENGDDNQGDEGDEEEGEDLDEDECVPRLYSFDWKRRGSMDWY